MYTGDIGNVVNKTCCRRELSEETSRELRPVDCKLRQTSLRNRKSNTIYTVLSILIRIRTRKIKIKRPEF